MKDTKIEWTDHTFSPWRGCTKVSAGCANCYAERQSKRNHSVLGVWGTSGSRPLASDAYWRQPHAWNAAAASAGVRARVFCASICDVFEGRDTMPAHAWHVVEGARNRLFDLISDTASLDWLLLTKRPENIIAHYLATDCARAMAGALPSNVWVGASVEDQNAAANRIPALLRVGARVRFLSCEPLLSGVDLRRIRTPGLLYGLDALAGLSVPPDGGPPLPNPNGKVEWVIVGGESGPSARTMDIGWVEEIVSGCQQTGTPVFVKQFGSAPSVDGGPLRLIDKKGGDPAEFPDNLRIRQFPKLTRTP